MIKILFVYHGNILKSPGKVDKINDFMKQSSAYFDRILEVLENARK